MRTFLGGRVGGRGSLLHFVDGFDDQEDDKGDDEEVDDGLDEHAPHDDRIADSGTDAAEIHAAHEQTDQRGKDVLDERADDLPKRAADDDGDGEVEHVAAHDEFPEFF